MLLSMRFIILSIFKFVLSILTIGIEIAFLRIADNSLRSIFASGNSHQSFKIWLRYLHVRDTGLYLYCFLTIVKWYLLISKSHWRSLELPRSGRFCFDICQMSSRGKATFIVRAKFDARCPCLINISINWKN